MKKDIKHIWYINEQNFPIKMYYHQIDIQSVTSDDSNIFICILLLYNADCTYNYGSKNNESVVSILYITFKIKENVLNSY